MPFQSEKQRRYLHANHPEIAKRWEKEYANGGYAMQGGVKNYLGNQKMVHAPKHWKSAPDHPETELTYITEPEKDLLVKADLHGSLNGNVNRGPEGIASLNGGAIYDVTSSSSSTNTGGGGDNREKYIATQYNQPKKKYTPPPGEKDGPGYVPPKKKTITPKDDKTPLYIKKKKKKKDVVDKTLDIAETGNFLYNLLKNPLHGPVNLYKKNPYILGGTLLKGLYDKNKKKKKSVDDQVSLIDENIVDIDVDDLSGDTDYTDIEGQLAFKVGSKKDKLLKSLHKERALTKDLDIPFPAKKEKKYQKLLKEDQEQTEHPKSELLTAASGGIANHFRKKFNTGSEPVIGDALFRGNWNDYSNEQLQMMFPDWDPEIESIDEHIKKKQSMNVDFAAVTEGNGILDLTEGEETTDVAEADTGEVIPSLVPSLDEEITLVANGGRILPKGPAGITSLNGWGDKDEGMADKSYGGSERYSQPTHHHSVDTPDQKVSQTSIDEAKRKAELKNLIETGPGSMEEKYDTRPSYLGEEFEEEYYGPRLAKEKKAILTQKTKEFLERNKKAFNPEEYYKDMPWYESIWEQATSVPTTLPGVILAVIKEQKLKKEAKALLDEWGQFVGGPPGTNPKPYDDLWLGLEKRKAKYKDQKTTFEGPEAVPLAPTIQLLEDEMYASRDMSAWDRIKANQVRRAMLVEKGIIQEDFTGEDNPITDITLRMDANRGGLANLFRVKNQ